MLCSADCCFSLYVRRDNPDLAFSVPPIDPDFEGPNDICFEVCTADKKAWDYETNCQADEDGFMGGVPLDCPIFQGEVDPPWESF